MAPLLTYENWSRTEFSCIEFVTLLVPGGIAGLRISPVPLFLNA
jgi:hypothetical protein